MRYAIDVHGTLADRQPDGSVLPSNLFPLLSGLMLAWVQRGDKVFILSGPTARTILHEVTLLGLSRGVHYTDVVSMVDFIRDSDEPMWEDPEGSGNWWCAPEVWQATKGRIAMDWKLDVVVDDTAENQAAMPASTTFVLVRTLGR